MDADTDDETLMLRYRDGDPLAFETLYARHKGSLYRYLLRQSNSAPVAEELFQDVWLKLIQARSRYTVKARFATWLYTLAHHRLIDHYRARSRGLPVSYREPDPDLDCPPDPAPPPEELVDRRRLAERLLKLLETLPEAQREAFLLREEGGLSVEDIAAATGVNRETAKSRLRYAAARLRRGLGEVT